MLATTWLPLLDSHKIPRIVKSEFVATVLPVGIIRRGNHNCNHKARAATDHVLKHVG